MPGSFFEQDHLLNLIILGVYANGWPKCARISKQKLMYPKIWSIFFFLTFTVGRPFHWRDFRRKNFGVKGLLFEEKEALHAELNERAEAATSSYSAAVDFIQHI